MKKFLTFIAFFAAMTMSSCMYDDTFVVNSISDLQKRVNALEQLQNASEQGLLIESVTEFEGGYVVKFSDGSEITLYHGTNGKDGIDGINGNDGIDGEGACVLEDIVLTDENVTFYLPDGRSFTFYFKGTERVDIAFDIEDGIACMAGASLEFGYTITGGYIDAHIECFGDGGWRARLIPNSMTAGRIKVTAPEMGGDGKIVVLVVSNSGGTCMKSILFDEGKIENIVDSYEVDWAANTLNVEFRTNLDYDVRIPAEAQSWISVAETRATMRDAYITLAISENPEGEPARTAIVELVNELGDILYSFEVNQQPQPSGEAIVFADQYAKLVCVQKYDRNGDGELSPKEAAAVTELGGNFFGDYSLAVRSFDELQYFINLNYISEAFSGCSNLKSITIPDSVTSIDWGAFSNCSSLTSVTIPDSVTSIEDGAFSGCSSLTSVTIPDSVTTIGGYAFSGCRSLTSVTIPDSVTTIEYDAFSGCSSLTSITIPNSVTKIGSSAFGGCSSLTSVTLSKNLIKIESSTFSGCSSLENISLPEGIISIDHYAFGDCDSLTTITIPSSVVSLGGNPFCYCDNIKEFKGNFTTNDGKALIFYDKFISFACKCGATEYIIPNGVTKIGDYAFFDCDSLTSVTIPDSVTTIGDYAFYDCDSLTSITIPDSVTTIGTEAFYSCDSLTSVYCKATTPPAGGSWMFNNNASGRKIYVPTESVQAYKSASYWSDYADTIEGYNF